MGPCAEDVIGHSSEMLAPVEISVREVGPHMIGDSSPRCVDVRAHVAASDNRALVLGNSYVHRAMQPLVQGGDGG